MELNLGQEGGHQTCLWHTEKISKLVRDLGLTES